MQPSDRTGGDISSALNSMNLSSVNDNTVMDNT